MNPIRENANRVLARLIESKEKNSSHNKVRAAVGLGEQEFLDALDYLKRLEAIELGDLFGMDIPELGFPAIKVLPRGRYLYHENLVQKKPEKPLRAHTMSETDLWKEVSQVSGVTRMGFARKLSFIPKEKRHVILRDVSHAYGCIKHGFYKSAVILSGGIIEEMLRIRLETKGLKSEKDKFVSYLECCSQHGVLKVPIAKLGDSVRGFRNLVHLANETSKRHAISKPTAIGAFNSIFTVANDFH